MSLGKLDVTGTLKQVEAMLRQDTTIAPPVRAMLELLVVVIHLLLAKLGLNSTNSSTPPSKDPYRQRGSKKSKGTQRKPGGQDGHDGTNLKQQAHPDRIETLQIDRRTIPSGPYTAAGFESRQVIDIEIIKTVTEFRAEILQDASGNQFVAQFPLGVTRPVQYGSSVKAQAVYMSQQQLIPYDRVRDYFTDQAGIPVSAGALFNFNQEAFDRLGTFESMVRRQLPAQPVLHADETGMNVNGKLLWLHAVSNDRWTLLFPHAKRGGAATKAMGVLAQFRGILCHDH